jgi:phosphoribosylamine---glycine ligase
MNVLVVGNGGREHVLCWKLAQSKKVSKIFCAPGNAGIAEEFECIDIPVSDLDGLAEFAVKNNIDLTVAGPEAPLCDGIVDVFRASGLKIFGPDKYAAQLEGSKDFAKNFIIKYNIPAAKSSTFTALEPAAEYIKNEFAAGEKGIVIKADGLAAGKGVLVADNSDDAIEFLKGCFDGAFGASGSRVLVEECLFGEEASILALVDGKTITPLASSQDHKRLLENDAGPNTGGMGAYSPAPVVDDKMMQQISNEVLDNFLVGVKAEQLDFKGLLFVGIMVTDKGPKVLEFNVRFGDPEVQAVLMRLESDLADTILKVVDGELDQAQLDWSDDCAVCVVMASGGYPVAYKKGYEITGLDAAAATGAKVFHAGTGSENGKIVNTGGRVLGVTARGNNIKTAISNAYNAVDKINWQDCIYRKDIAYRALERADSY